MSKTGIQILFGAVVLLLLGFAYRSYTFRHIPSSQPGETAGTEGVQKDGGILHSIPLSDIVSAGPPRDAIPSIDRPEVESVTLADQYLKDEGYGLVIEVGGSYRFYPYQILVWHEIVNERVGGKALVVTYCPLCNTGIVYERNIGNDLYEFGTSGKLWNNNLLMYDRQTNSFWSQSLGRAVVGEKTGAQLTAYPSLTMSWKDFKTAFPRGSVLTRETGAVRDYTRNPYGDYSTSAKILFALTHRDVRLAPKTLVWGAEFEEGTKAYINSDIEAEQVINDVVRDEPILVLFDETLQAVRAYKRKNDGTILRFVLEQGAIKDKETGSTWNLDGEAVAGDLRGETLEPFVLKSHFWFAWAAIHPETELYEAP